MPAVNRADLTISIAVAMHPSGSQRITISGGEAEQYLDIPTGYVVMVAPSPWWVRLRAWAKLSWFRVRNG